VTVAGLVTHRQQPPTARGVVFLSLEDETGMLNVICPPHVWARDRRALPLTGAALPALLVCGRIERTGGAVNLVATALRPLRAVPLPSGGSAPVPARKKFLPNGPFSPAAWAGFHALCAGGLLVLIWWRTPARDRASPERTPGSQGFRQGRYFALATSILEQHRIVPASRDAAKHGLPRHGAPVSSSARGGQPSARSLRAHRSDSVLLRVLKGSGMGQSRS
jgi:hypothetical protein